MTTPPRTCTRCYIAYPAKQCKCPKCGNPEFSVPREWLVQLEAEKPKRRGK